MKALQVKTSGIVFKGSLVELEAKEGQEEKVNKKYFFHQMNIY